MKFAPLQNVGKLILLLGVLLASQARALAKPPATPVRASLDRSLSQCLNVRVMLPEISKIAQTIARRHEAGGMIGFPFESQSLVQEILGRSGGMVHVGFTRPWKASRSDAEKQQDVGIVAYDRPPGGGDVAAMRKLKERGCYLVGIGSKGIAHADEVAMLCDAWIDSGDVQGRQATLINAVIGWTLTAEIVGALTRNGKMPTMWKSYSFADGSAWGARYLGKQQFHEDFHVQPQAVGELGTRFLDQIESNLQRIMKTETTALEEAAQQVNAEVNAGRKVIVAWQGHMPPAYIGKIEDTWAVVAELHPSLPSQVEHYRKEMKDGALVLSLGYCGLSPVSASLWKEKKQRIILLCGDHPDPAWRSYDSVARRIDLGFEFGDACVALEGYPIKIFAPSGIVQLAAFDAILAGVSAQHGATLGNEPGYR